MSGPIIIPWKGVTPKIAPDAFIAPNVVLIGDIVIGSKASIWFNCVLRADINFIRIGERTNIQDGTVIHVDSGGPTGVNNHPTVIGDDVLVGHMAMIHGCTLENGSFVGMSSILLDGVVVESDAMVAAGSLVSIGKRVPRGQLWAGRPAKLMRDLRPDEYPRMKWSVEHYAELGEAYRKQLG
jgi:carbonic anhydrase/acetyltransferase-like protein (isoleucine patch superfamily)